MLNALPQHVIIMKPISPFRHAADHSVTKEHERGALQLIILNSASYKRYTAFDYLRRETTMCSFNNRHILYTYMSSYAPSPPSSTQSTFRIFPIYFQTSKTNNWRIVGMACECLSELSKVFLILALESSSGCQNASLIVNYSTSIYLLSSAPWSWISD